MAVALAKAHAEESIMLRAIMTHLVRRRRTRPSAQPTAGRQSRMPPQQTWPGSARRRRSCTCQLPAGAGAARSVAGDPVRPELRCTADSAARSWRLWPDPVMTPTGEISLVKRVAAGGGVVSAHLGGPQDTVVAVVPAGYAGRRAAHPVRQVRGAGERPTVPGSGPSLYGSVRHRSGPDGGGVAEGDLAELFGTRPRRRVDRSGLGRRHRHHRLRDTVGHPWLDRTPLRRRGRRWVPSRVSKAAKPRRRRELRRLARKPRSPERSVLLAGVLHLGTLGKQAAGGGGQAGDPPEKGHRPGPVRRRGTPRRSTTIQASSVVTDDGLALAVRTVDLWDSDVDAEPEVTVLFVHRVHAAHGELASSDSSWPNAGPAGGSGWCSSTTVGTAK